MIKTIQPLALAFCLTPMALQAQTISNNQSIQGFVNHNNWQHYQLELDASVSEFSVTLDQLSADADLYIKQGSRPNSNQFDCRPYKGNRTTETCTLSNSQDSTWYIAIHGYQPAQYRLSNQITQTQQPTPDESPDIPADTTVLTTGEAIISHVNFRQQKHYTIIADASHSTLQVDLTNLSNDVDLYVKAGAKPGQNDYQCRPYKGGQTSEHCTLENNGDTIWFITVDGYKASNYTLTASLSSAYPTTILPLSIEELDEQKAIAATFLEGNLCIALDDYGFIDQFCMDGTTRRDNAEDADTEQIIADAKQALLAVPEFSGVTNESDLIVKSVLDKTGKMHNGEQGIIGYQVRFEQQTYAGIPVVNGDELRVYWNPQDGADMLWGGHWYPLISIPESDTVDADQAIALSIGETVGYSNAFPPYASNEFIVQAEHVEGQIPRKVIFVNRENSQDNEAVQTTLHVAWEVIVSISDDDSFALKWRLIIDSTTGEVIDTLQLFYN